MILILLLVLIPVLIYRWGTSRLKIAEEQGKDRPRLRKNMKRVKAVLDLLVHISRFLVQSLITLLKYIQAWLDKQTVERDRLHCLCFWPIRKKS